MATPTTSVSRNLVGDANGHRYLFIELMLPAEGVTLFRRHDDDQRTHVVIGGAVELQAAGDWGRSP